MDDGFNAFAFGIDTQVLATDSVVLREQDVTAAIKAVEESAAQGDVLDGLRYAVVLSAVLWVAIIVGGFFLFL